MKNYYYYFYPYPRKRFYSVTFKLEDIHRHKFCATTFFICHYTDIGNGECQPRIEGEAQDAILELDTPVLSKTQG